ncbi:MAG: hypothetical protein K0R08_905 [Solimicrobium sp.]|jgi:hypothetical protein|nr:hypothetical protein [Solimicrobium sp.]
MRWFSLITLATLCSACTGIEALHDIDSGNVNINFPPTAVIESNTQADRVLQAVELSRAQIEWRYTQMEQICYNRFFINSCLLEAKNKRRNDLAKVKKSEVDANFFKRKYKVEEMDRVIKERNR